MNPKAGFKYSQINFGIFFDSSKRFSSPFWENKKGEQNKKIILKNLNSTFKIINKFTYLSLPPPLFPLGNDAVSVFLFSDFLLPPNAVKSYFNLNNMYLG